jgi:filamentous hemagglutinin family protein
LRFFTTALAWLACAPLAHAGSTLLLAPGHSVTLIDVSDPALRVVVTAPAAAPLDLSRLLVANGKSSMLSIVTAVRLGAPGALVANPDGSLAIAAIEIPHPEESALADGAVLVFSEGRYVGVTTPAALSPAPAAQLDIAPRDSLNFGAMIPAASAKAPSGALPQGPSALVPSGAIAIGGPAALTPTAALTATGALGGVPNPGVINLQSFSISGSGSITAGGSTVLNGVTGQSPAMISGAITSNGTVQISNPNGVPISSGGAITATGTSSGSVTTLK